MRAIWRGYISLGQFGIPVRLYTGSRSVRPHFTQLHETDGSPVERPLRCLAEQRDISAAEVIRAIQLPDGKYLTFTNDELSATATTAPRSVAIQQFCDETAIPPWYYDKLFYTIPGRGGERGYALLRTVLAKHHKVAICQFTLYGTTHLAALGVAGDLLMLYQLRYTSELVPRSSLRTPALPRPSSHEVHALEAVMERLSGPVYLEDYHDTYGEQLQDLIDRKTKQLPPSRPERIEPHTTTDEQLISTLENLLHAPAPLGP